VGKPEDESVEDFIQSLAEPEANALREAIKGTIAEFKTKRGTTKPVVKKPFNLIEWLNAKA
jgi:hypothetical protein